MLYFAYGMNLDPANMRDHKEIGPAVLYGWELIFGSCAYIQRRNNSLVHGAVWDVDDFTLLDALEGYKEGREGMNHYERSTVQVDLAGDTHDAIVYHLAPGKRIFSGQPSHYYLETMQNGYRHFGLPTEFLEGRLRVAKHRESAIR